MNEQTGVVYEFDQFSLDPARRLLMRAGSEAVALTGKPFDALVYLVQRAGTVVTRQELVAALWPTTIVEDNNLSQTITALRRALGDSQETPRFVATVPRRGYQFVAAVRSRFVQSTAAAPSGLVDEARGVAAARPPGPPDGGSAAHIASTRERRRTALIAVGALALVAATTLAIVAVQGASKGSAAISSSVANPAAGANRTALPSSVAVLPFRNLSPDQNDAYFAAGIHEEILSRLAKVRGLNVIAATSVLQYADGTAPIGQIAQDLKVATIMEGSVRYAPDRVRVSVRLIDATTSVGVWSEDYDVEPRGVFDIQSDIAAKIVAALEPELSPPPAVPAQAPPTESTRAYALYLRTLALYRTHGGLGVSIPHSIREAMRSYLEEALALDAEFAAALAWRAHLDMDSLLVDPPAEESWRSSRAALMQQVEDDARRSIGLDPAQAIAHATMARLDLFRFRFAEALGTLERALEVNPNDLVLLHYMAMTRFLRDEHAEAIRVARRAIELDPKNPAPHTPLGMALRATGEAEAAATAYSAMIEAAPTALIGYVGLARTRTATGDAARVLEPLRLAEHFLEDARNFRVDAAYSYARAGLRDEAARLIAEFRRAVDGRHVDPGLEAMASLALGEHARAHEQLRAALADRAAGMDPLPLALLRQNTWSDPVLEQPEWLALRAELGFRR